MRVRRFTGLLKEVELDTKGPLFARVELKYELEGTDSYSVMLTAYSSIPRVDVSVRINKNNRLEPENVYIALPFTTGQGQKPQLWIEKTGHILRPRVDQLPGTGVDFYCVQEGVTYSSEEKGLVIAMPDTPMIQLGPLEFGERQLMGYNGIKEDGEHLYSWVMNNYWETNFKGTIGGFYEFRFSVNWGKELGNPETAITRCHSINTGLIGIRVTDRI